jgi:hypothetical protein
MRYALMISSDEEAHVGTEAEQGAGFQAQAEKLGSRLVSSVRLRPTNTATTVRVRDGDVVIADGPFAETKEQIGGFLLVECEDLTRRSRWRRRSPPPDTARSRCDRCGRCRRRSRGR